MSGLQSSSSRRPRQEAGLAKPSRRRETEKFAWEACSGFLRRWMESCKSDLLAGQTELLRAGRSRGFWPAASSLPRPASSSWRESSGLFQQPDLGPCSTPTIPTWHTVSGLRTQKLSSRRARFRSPGPRVMGQARASPGLEGGC